MSALQASVLLVRSVLISSGVVSPAAASAVVSAVDRREMGQALDDAVLHGGMTAPHQKVLGGKVGGRHSHKAAADRSCRCRSPFSRAYRGSCLPSFMVIGSQKAATSKLRWYLSRHPEIEIPKEEAFHSGPKAVTAWDTKADPLLLSNYLAQFNDVCNTTSITGLKMPDYIVMSTLTIEHFHKENPGMRIIVTLREPVARMYSYFSMQLRFGWSPINHMGKNPCMQQQLRAILKEKEARAQRGEIVKLNFTSEEIMVTNLKCVRPCYASNASGVGPEAEEEIWHNEKLPECKNIYFTPLVHSMYALHIRRWLRIFDREAMLLLRFDDLVLHPLEVLQKVAHFLKISNFAANFKYEVGRENFTTIERLLQSGAVTRSSVQMLQAFFAPHDEALHKMFPGEKFY
ncbi:hypothetical protein AB1Y20_011662 [Prymnesium parvum]|uniref:Sulfotransferase domain-containing protein n=1 Tax=Prymnesium parvum TaxID=97485 RepID=A0AB34IHP5_PRYPA